MFRLHLLKVPAHARPAGHSGTAITSSRRSAASARNGRHTAWPWPMALTLDQDLEHHRS
jgi:hypothetical protein